MFVAFCGGWSGKKAMDERRRDLLSLIGIPTTDVAVVEASNGHDKK